MKITLDLWMYLDFSRFYRLIYRLYLIMLGIIHISDEIWLDHRFYSLFWRYSGIKRHPCKHLFFSAPENNMEYMLLPPSLFKYCSLKNTQFNESTFTFTLHFFINFTLQFILSALTFISLSKIITHFTFLPITFSK